MKLFGLKKDESGAVTVDWVVLAAALILLVGTVVTVVQNGLQSAASTISENVNTTVK
ncbi:MAG: hypothetical protein AAGJ34_01250 [Pseudomonadota bacterium]